MTEDETVGWHHQLNGHKFEQTLKDVEGQRVCTSFHRVTKESDTTERLNNNPYDEKNIFFFFWVLILESLMGLQGTIQNLWDAAKAVLRGKFIAIQSYLKKQEKHQKDNLTLQLKVEKEEEEQQQQQQN